MNLGEEIIKRYEDIWFVEDRGQMTFSEGKEIKAVRYIQFLNYDDERWFEIAVLDWDLVRLEIRKISEVAKFSKLHTVKESVLIEKLNKAKRKLITKQLIRRGERGTPINL